MRPVGEVAHMAVTRLRSRRDARQEDGIARLREAIQDAADVVPVDVLGRIVHMLDRELSSRRGWGFVMVEPHLYAGVVTHLTEHSRRPLKAVRLWTQLFTVLPSDSNEVMADREELARMVGLRPQEVSELMGELEARQARLPQARGPGRSVLRQPAARH